MGRILGRCPDCDQLVEITPDARQHATRGTSRWWRLALHTKGPDTGELCDGGGKLV